MRKLILIKHASPLVDPATPSEQWKLSDRGIESCAPLAEKLRPHAPQVIITSEQPKARQTGQLLADALQVPIETAPGLQEHDRSNVPHMRSGEFISHMELFFRRPSDRVLGKESADEALKRFESAIESVLHEHPEQDLAIVSHGTVLALYIASHTGQRPFELWRAMGLPSMLVLQLPGNEIVESINRIT
jgi:broad specificity phosphatase PhoE